MFLLGAARAAPSFLFKILKVLRGGLPPVQEFLKIFGTHGACVFELAIFLAVNQLPIGIQHGQARYAALHGDLILIHQVLILFSAPNVDMHDFIVDSDDRSEIRAMESLVEHMTEITPVCSKNDDHPLMFGGRLL